jgi:hypothetical protein
MLRVAHFIVILCVAVLSVVMQRVVMLSVIYWCRYAECHYAESHHVAFILQIVFTFLQKQARLMRGLTVMNRPLQSVLPALSIWPIVIREIVIWPTAIAIM